ncbi:hypothetical protein DS2_14599 [Catenovulum agarivorans DS-2]|uniref:Uncharacterized protein n=2 Tax=Catenovulum agarivorans TaxID=1172192 RepID=W7QJ92_9ALTE|nr:hypothetical protein DS2_14599 [Catenovulum agarivorans DS-2]
MKFRYIAGVIAILCNPIQVFASTEDFKCYVQLHNKTHQIAFVDGSQVSSTAQAAKTLLNQGFYAEDGKSIIKIKKVIECQKMYTSFVDVNANIADERTPR